MVVWVLPILTKYDPTMKPATVIELRATIERECIQIPREMFHDVCYSIAWRCWQGLDQNEHEFENRGQNNGMMFGNVLTC